jgi:threonine dehydratase
VLAAVRLRDRVRETPLNHSTRFSRQTGANVFFKLENLQHTGSFKLRGAFNRLLALRPDERRAGAVAASSGNHGAAVALALSELRIPGVIFVPAGTSPLKVEAIRAAGGDVRFFGDDGLDTETHARCYADLHGMVYVSPYNDAAVIAGQGSCGVEITRQLPAIDALFVAVGGGGLVSGVGAVLKRARPDTRVYGCQPANSPVMAASVEAGHIVELPGKPTLSDGTAGGIEPGALTFELCRDIVDEFVLVDEAGIAGAMRAYMDAEHQLIEGAAGVAVAGMLARAGEFSGGNLVVLVCGANISRETLAGIL